MPSSEHPLGPDEIVGAGLCVGCGACTAGETAAAMAFDRHGHLKPSGGERWRRRQTDRFARICPFASRAPNEDEIAAARFPTAPVSDAHVGWHEGAFVGHVAEGDFRAEGSSGGLVSWTAAELMRLDLVDGVAHVAPTPDPAPGERLFRYRISRSPDEVRTRSRSRYYPVDLSGILQEIAATPGRYAVVGLPCFIKAVHLLRAEDPILRERIVFTLGLFCGHMKSARMIDSFAWQMGADPNEVVAIEYREKDASRPANWYRARLTFRNGDVRRRDWWHFADGDWGAGFFQNEACDFCDDVAAETADIAFGDAWVEPYASDGRGANVVVTRARALDRLVRDAVAAGRLTLGEVDAEFVRDTQAAGFRQRREGLALRLATRKARGRLMPRKRVPAEAPRLTPRRWAVYRMREGITRWSRRWQSASRRLRWPGLYLGWARASLTIYQALAWSQGRLGTVIDLLERRFSSPQRR